MDRGVALLDSLVGRGSRCVLCGEKPDGSTLLNCSHRLCLDCYADYTTVVGDAEDFRCPNGCENTGISLAKCPTDPDNMEMCQTISDNHDNLDKCLTFSDNMGKCRSDSTNLTPERENIHNDHKEQAVDGDCSCRLQEADLSQVTCSSCESSDVVATAVCDECEGILCDDCVKAHTKMRRLMKSHCVVSIEDLMTGNVQMKPRARRCDNHPDERLNFFCSTCRDLVCSQCAVIKHTKPDHECLDLETAATNFNNDMMNLFSKCASKLAEVTEKHSRIEKQRRDVDLEIETLEQIVDRAADEIIDAINANRKKLHTQIAEIKNVLADKMDRIQGSTHFVVDTLTSAKKLICRENGKSGFQLENSKADIFFDRVDELLKRKEREGEMEEVQEYVRRIGFKRATSCSDQMGAVGEIFQVSEWEVHRQHDLDAHVSAMTAFRDGRIAIACDDERDGVTMVLTNGSKDRVLDGVEVKHIAALSDGQFIIIDHDNHLRLFSAEGREDHDIVFERPDDLPDRTSVPVCVIESNQGQDFLVGYSGVPACYNFPILGGMHTSKIPTGDVCPKQLMVTTTSSSTSSSPDGQSGMRVIAVNSPKVAVISEVGTVLWRVEESNASAIVPAVFNDHIFIASIQIDGNDNGAADLTIDRYTVDGDLVDSPVQSESVAFDEAPTQIQMIMISQVKLAVSIGKRCLVFNGPQSLTDIAEEM